MVYETQCSIRTTCYALRNELDANASYNRAYHISYSIYSLENCVNLSLVHLKDPKIQNYLRPDL